MAKSNCIGEMFFEKGLSYAKISRVTGHDVKTVGKYLHGYDESKKAGYTCFYPKI
ncbi:MAG: hypothetical protein GX349_04045 [Firmicutes bacterium]|nr:hypothetical protein [Bacillota bacterium]